MAMRRIERLRVAALAGVAVAVVTGSVPSAGIAAFPGENGRIAYIAEPAGSNQPEIFTILPDGSGSQQLTRNSGFEGDLDWSADGRRLVFTMLSLDFDGSTSVFTMNAGGGPLGGPGSPSPGRAKPSFSPGGGRVVFSRGGVITTARTKKGNRARFDLRAREIRPGSGCCLDGPEYSPDGERIVFSANLRGSRSDGIWTIRRDGSRLRQLTAPPEGAVDEDPDYRPDGRRIVFGRLGTGGNQIYTMRADGSRERPVRDTAFSAGATWAPSGDRILGVTGGSGCSDLYSSLPSGLDRRPITQNCSAGDPASLGGPSWQPLPPG